MSFCCSPRTTGHGHELRGMRRRYEPRGQPHFVLPPNLYMGPPVGGTFWFQIFIQASSPEIWSETISGGEEVLAGKWGGLFLGYLIRKKFIGSRGEVPPSSTLGRRQDSERFKLAARTCRWAVAGCGPTATGQLVVTDGAGKPHVRHETPPVHHTSRRRGGRVAARGARRRLAACVGSAFLIGVADGPEAGPSCEFPTRTSGARLD